MPELSQNRYDIDEEFKKIDKDLFCHCANFILKRDYSLLDRIANEVDFFLNPEIKDFPLITFSLLHFIYYEILNEDLQKFYINIRVLLNNCFYLFEHAFLTLQKDLEEMNPPREIALKLNSFINTYIKVYDTEFEITNPFLDSKKIFIEDLYLSNYSYLNDLEIYGLIFINYFIQKDVSLDQKTKDIFLSYVWNTIGRVIAHKSYLFENDIDEDEYKIDKVFEAQTEAMVLK